ncbi:MAG: cryptochrome/photolyase family protein [Bacteroidota bacterium]
MSNTVAKSADHNAMDKNSANIIFPNQLFLDSPLFNGHAIYLVEEHLFFRQYNFHKQKLAFHRASMKSYESLLKQKGFDPIYIESQEDRADIRKLIPELIAQGIKTLHLIDPTDNWLEKRIFSFENELKITLHENPAFINTKSELTSFFRTDKKKFFQTKFYIAQRKARGVLLEKSDMPKGGKWSFDAENRKKYPKKKNAPSFYWSSQNEWKEEAVEYINLHFSENLGELKEVLYPIDHEQSERWLKTFFEDRFHEFGTYEDAIVKDQNILHHSVLTPMLNTGLIKPLSIVHDALIFSKEQEVPLNSVEGFVRQIMGWREFIRGVYQVKGSAERTRNFWGFERKMPDSFYKGETGIPPIDITIKKVLKTGYCHHIERLMILGNFMLLCEFDPDEVYQWFMELFIDAYDWVMVPNVYGMSQFADEGMMSTKPYISGSNYIIKMSDFQKGEWQAIWDGLFWRFMHVNRDFFLSNPRLGMLVKTFDKMSPEKRNIHLSNAETYLAQL